MKQFDGLGLYEVDDIDTANLSVSETVLKIKENLQRKNCLLALQANDVK